MASANPNSSEDNQEAKGEPSKLSPQSEEDWERKLARGELPEDFLKVTEPKNSPVVDRTTKPKNMAATNAAFEPEVGNLVDVDDSNPAREAVLKPRDEGEKGLDRPLSTEEQDRAMAMALQEQLNMEDAEEAAVAQANPAYYARPVTRTVAAPANMIGKLTVTVVEARLAKNYGYTRMDPYCRVRVGHSVFETTTCNNGAKEPKWNKTFTCYLLQGIKNIDIEVYDECTVRQDSLIAEGSFPIPESVMQRNEVSDEWFSLSGNEGPGKEGMIHLILSLQPIEPGQPMQVQAPPRQVANLAAGGKPYQTAYIPGQQQQQQQQPPPPPPKLSEEELEEFSKMFSNLDKEIILSVFHTCNGNKEQMVNNLLQMGQQ